MPETAPKTQETTAVAKSTFSYHGGRKHELKTNGLPKGYGLYWFDPRPKAEKEANPENAGSKYIYVKFRGRGVSCQTKDWKRAVDFVEELRKKHAESNKPMGRLTVDDLLDNYISYLTQLNKERGEYNPKTAEIVTMVAKKHVRPFFGKIRAEMLMHLPDKQRQYRQMRTEQLGQKTGKPTDQVQHTIDKELSIVRAAYNRAVKENRISQTIMPTFSIDKNNAKAGTRHGTFTEGQIKTLSERLPRPVNVMLLLCLAVGSRKRETTFIRRESVKWEERLITLRPNETKRDKNRGGRILGVPMSVWTLILDWEEETRRTYPKAEFLFHLEGQRIETQQLDELFNKTCEELGWHKPRRDVNNNIVRGKNRCPLYDRSPRWHDSRRNATTDAPKDGVNDIDRKRVLGMSDETLDRYDKTQSAIKMRDALDKKNGVVFTVPTTTVVVTPAVEAVSADPIREKLIRLKTLLDGGLIDESEYREHKSRILVQL